MGSQRAEQDWVTFTFLSLTTNDRERGYLSINTESNSININAYIPKQAGSTHKPLSLKEKEKKKRPEKERFRVKELNWNPHLVLASLPAVLKKKREENPKSVCIKVPFPMAEGLIKIFRCFSAAWKAFFFLWNSYITGSGSNNSRGQKLCKWHQWFRSTPPSSGSLSWFPCLQSRSGKGWLLQEAVGGFPNVRPNDRIQKKWTSPYVPPWFFQ